MTDYTPILLLIAFLGATCFLLSTHRSIPESVQRTTCWYLGFVATIAAGIYLATLSVGCAPPAKSVAELRSRVNRDPRDASVVIMARREYWHWSDHGNPGSLRAELTPVCSGFVLRDSDVGLAGVKIYTAAHCLRGAKPGADVVYVDRSTWEKTSDGYSLARVLIADTRLDRAVLSPLESADAAKLDAVALTTGPEPEAGAHVQSVSAYFNFATLSGDVRVGIYNAGAHDYVTDLDVRPGWSGAPALDVYGHVIGIVRACEGEAIGELGATRCKPHTGTFVSLEGLH